MLSPQQPPIGSNLLLSFCTAAGDAQELPGEVGVQDDQQEAVGVVLEHDSLPGDHYQTGYSPTRRSSM